MKQIDYVKAFTKVHNLITAPDVNQDNKLTIEPFNDYISTGTSRDWTQVMDISKDQVVTPVVDVQNKTLEFTYTEDLDILNKIVKDKGKRIYGRKIIEDSENDFATSSKKITTEFAPTPLNAIIGTTVVIPKFINDKGETIDAKPRLLFWCGSEAIEADSIYAWMITLVQRLL